VSATLVNLSFASGAVAVHDAPPSFDPIVVPAAPTAQTVRPRAATP
jgi:hypothetical protein